MRMKLEALRDEQIDKALEPENKEVEISASTDAMEGTGNLLAVMDAMGHEKIDTTRLYNHPGTKQIRDAIERRNQWMQ